MREIAELILLEAFENLGVDASDWFRSSVFGEWAENPNAVRLRERQRDISMSMRWGSSIPRENVPQFLAMVLGRDLLRFAPARCLLLESRLTSPTDGKEFLEKYKKIEGVEKSEVSVDELLLLCKGRSWIPSTRYALDFCELIELPPQFAQAGSSSGVPPVVFSEPVRSLLPLLDFQELVKERIIDALRDSSTAYVIMPTGSGKTRTSVEAAVGFLDENGSSVDRVLWIADRSELCEQAVDSFLTILPHRNSSRVQISRYWSGNSLDLDIDSDGKRFIPGVTITSTQQIRNRLEAGEPVGRYLIENSRIIIIDEVHRNLKFNEGLVEKVRRINPECGIIGLTATPYRRIRHETGRFVRMFENPITPVEGDVVDIEEIRRALEDREILAKQVDVSAKDIGLRLSVGSTPGKRLSEAVGIVNEFINTGSRSILVFAESVDHSNQIASALVMQGVSAQHMDSGTVPEERRKIVEDYRNGDVQVLVNYDILTTGFDAPLTDSVIILRGTDDLDQPLITQMIGRGLRGPRFGGTEECRVFIRGR
tara:strand:- start:132 stop:1748 length:1617 start_codon:yes stop_codon:yes gene_type:complete